jgi:hypothetical protein
VLVLTLALAGCGGATAPESVEAKLRRHLVARDLSVSWVRCVPGDGGVYRCNVSFGDPHVQVYCAVVVDGELRAAEWRQAVHGRQDRAAAASECAQRLGSTR